MSLEGVEVAAKITGSAAKELAVMIYAVLKDQKRTKGKTRLTSMLRSEKPLKVFAVKDQDLKLFCKEAKRYGVLYCVLKDKDATDGLTDIMVRADDAAKINRIFERFKLATVDVGEVRSEIEREMEGQEPVTPVGDELPVPVKVQAEDREDAFLDQLMGKSPTAPKEHNENPTQARTTTPRQSEPSSEPKGRAASEPDPRPSVRAELKKIREEQKKTAEQPNKERSGKAPKGNQHKQPSHSKKKKHKKSKER